MGNKLAKGIFTNTDVSSASLFQTDFLGAAFTGADFSHADLAEVTNWEKRDFAFDRANIYGVKNAPEGFREFALKNGACEFKDKKEWLAYKEALKAYNKQMIINEPVCKKDL